MLGVVADRDGRLATNVDLSGYDFIPEVVRRVPRALAMRYDVLSLAVDGNQLTVAIPEGGTEDIVDRVRDNETIVLGGLLRDIDSETVTKVPYLGDIPVFGQLFRNRDHTHEKDEVVFLITPHVLTGNQTMSH